MSKISTVLSPLIVLSERSSTISFSTKTNTSLNPNQMVHRIEETHFIQLIHACKTTAQLQQIHAQLFRQNLISCPKITTQLISSASSRHSIRYALSIFNSFNSPNLFIYNALIRGLTDNSYHHTTLDLFRLMLRQDIRPNWLTFPYVLKSCAALNEKQLGWLIHGVIIKVGLEFDLFVRVTLVDLYGKVELINLALKMFHESSERNKNDSVLLWNVTINACCKSGGELLDKAVDLFEGMPERNVGSWNSLINGLMRGGKVEEAMKLFARMGLMKNVVSWTTVIQGLSQNGMHERAINVFFEMVEANNVRPNDFTLVSALSACTKMGALEAGMRIHSYVSCKGFKLTPVIGNVLVDMYAKCGRIQVASQVFEEMKGKDIRSWSIMIWGWAIHGDVDHALQCFEKMKSTGIKPDYVTFLAVLTACSHAGRVNQGLQIFDSMKECGVEPTLKHYAMIVDLYGRAGQLDEALKFIQSMPVEPDSVIWGALFSACRTHKNIKMAKFASEKLLEVAPQHPGSYVFLSNVYAGIGMWEDVERVRVSMKDNGLGKDPGWSFIEANGQVYNFVANDHIS